MRLYIGREYLFEAGRKSWLVQILFKVKQDWIVILEFQMKEVNFGNEDFCSNSGGLETKIILSFEYLSDLNDSSFKLWFDEVNQLDLFAYSVRRFSQKMC